MNEYKTHCSKCGTPLTEEEVSYHDSGSLVTDPVDLCEYCDTHTNGMVDLDSFLDEADFFNSIDGRWDD